jgi:hypothetical protein
MMRPLILLLLDPGQHLARTLVLDDGRVTDALQMVEDGVGKGGPFQRISCRPSGRS